MRSRITSEEMPLGKLRLLEGSRGRGFGCYSIYACYHYFMVPILDRELCRVHLCRLLSVLAYVGQGK